MEESIVIKTKLTTRKAAMAEITKISINEGGKHGSACFLVRLMNGFYVGYYLNDTENLGIAFGSVPWNANEDVVISSKQFHRDYAPAKWSNNKNILTMQEQAANARSKCK